MDMDMYLPRYWELYVLACRSTGLCVRRIGILVTW